MKWFLISFAVLSVLMTFVAVRLVRAGSERPVPKVVGTRRGRQGWFEFVMLVVLVIVIALAEYAL